MWRGVTLALCLLATVKSSSGMTFNINNMEDALDGLNDFYSDLINYDDILNDPIPLVGKSVNELWSNDPEGTINDLLDFGGFITQAVSQAGSNDLNASQITDELFDFIAGLY